MDVMEKLLNLQKENGWISNLKRLSFLREQRLEMSFVISVVKLYFILNDAVFCDVQFCVCVLIQDAF